MPFAWSERLRASRRRDASSGGARSTLDPGRSPMTQSRFQASTRALAISPIWAQSMANARARYINLMY